MMMMMPNKTLALTKTCQVSVCALYTLPPVQRLLFQFRIPTKPRIRPLAKMSSFSLSWLHLLDLLRIDKWQPAKCDVKSSMHSVTNTFSSTPLLEPHSVYDLAEELLDGIAEKANFHNWSLRRFHWHNWSTQRYCFLIDDPSLGMRDRPQ